METTEKENINFWKQKAEEIRVQLNLGAAEAADKYEEEKKAVRNWIHETEQKIKENGDSRLDKLKTKLEELKVQASLGRADARDEFEEQRKKFNTKLHEARQEAKELSQKADSKSKEIGDKVSQRLQAWQTQFDIFNVQLHLGAKEASEKWNEQKGKFKLIFKLWRFFQSLKLFLLIRLNKGGKKRVGGERFGLEFGMKLHSDKPGMLWQFHDFDKRAIGACSGKPHPIGFELLAVLVIEFITMAMPLGNLARPIRLAAAAVTVQLCHLPPQSHRAAHLRDVTLFIEQADHGMRRILIELA